MNRFIAHFTFVALALTCLAIPAQAQDDPAEKELAAAFQQGMALLNQGKPSEAIPLLQKAAALADKVFGPDHLNTAGIHNSAGYACDQAHRFREAEQHHRRSLAIRQAKLPESDDRVAISLHNLGMTCMNLGKYADAEANLKRSLELSEKYLPKNDLGIAHTALNVGLLYLELGRFDDAVRHFSRGREIRELRLGKDHVEVAVTLQHLAAAQRQRGEVKDALMLAMRSMEIREAKLGKEHVAVAYSLNELGLTLRELGRLGEAETHLRRALALRERHLGKDHPLIGSIANNLAMVLSDLDQYGEAELLFRRVLAIREKNEGRENDLASVLNNLALLIAQTGRVEEAERLLERSLEIRQKALGKDDVGLLSTLNNLAALHHYNGQYKKAEALLERCLQVGEARFGKENFQLCATLNNLANVYSKTARYQEARTLHLRTLKIRETQLGPGELPLSITHANLAQLDYMLGDFDKADKRMATAVQIGETKLGREHVALAAGLNSWAQIKQAMNLPLQALAIQERSLALHQAQLLRTFAYSSESAMHHFAEVHRNRLHVMLNLAAQPDADRAVREQALTWTFRLKGAVFDTLCRFRQAQQALGQDAAMAERAALYRKRKEMLANAALSPPAGENRDQAAKKLALAQEEVDELEKELNRFLAGSLPDSANSRSDVNVAAVRKRLPPQSALIEFTRTPVIDFKKASWGEAHYFAFVLTPGDEPPRLVDLGSAAAIDAGIDALRQEFADFQEKLRDCETAAEAAALEKAHEKSFKDKSAALHRRLFAPLAKTLGDASLLYVAANGAINRLPLEALVDDGGKYVIERYRFAYLASGRDLLRSADAPGKGTVVFAGPDFKLSAEDRIARADKLLNRKEAPPATRGAASPGLRSAGWKHLPGAAAEATDIRKSLHQGAYGPVTSHIGPDALEEVLKTMKAPRILHLATHGFFLDREPAATDSDDDGAGAGFIRGRLKREANPLLRSGIVLAGANTIGDKEDSNPKVEDGWVTAEEIAILNLRGTELIVLSACQTGLGDIRNGEGVYGLRRAFLYAGAQTLVTSLFEVPDTETRLLMQRFYAGLASGRGKLVALRDAQLQLIADRRKSQGAAHPFFWASFVLVGNPD